MARALQTLQIVTFLCVAAVVTLGYSAAAGAVPLATHIKWGFLGAMVPAFTHSMTLFYLIGSSGNVREAIRPHGFREYLPEMASFHRILSPWLTFAIAGAIASVITGGGAHTRIWPAWLHQATALSTLALNAVAMWKGIRVIAANVRLQTRLDAALREADRRAGALS
ncbi:MAG TPA: hypothetical protein VE404_09120 [Verrucomicrobiae bacterium]|nr:hypothetical protein [Verrucomicrobiae bacterium]